MLNSGRVYISVKLLTIARILPRLLSTRCEIDTLDTFTSQLIEKQIKKWDLRRQQSEGTFSNTTASNCIKNINIEELAKYQLDDLFQTAIDEENAKTLLVLTKFCVKNNKLPPFSIVNNAVSICSKFGEKDVIYDLETLCYSHYPDFLKENSNFQHFLAEAVWVRGDTTKAIDLFENIYRSNPYLRRKIRAMLKYLITDLVKNRSEAALWNIINFSERILSDFKDIVPLTCVWEACFLSEWFTDQCIALELVERNNGLCTAVINRIPYVVFISLKCHRTEAVYRLLEILLKYKMEVPCRNVLSSLLRYQCN